jgi:protein phosphatase
MQYNIHFACLSHIGNVRAINQDNYICDGHYRDPFVKNTEFPLCGIKVSKQTPVFGVFDGMGGEECGEVASLIAAKTAAALEIGKKPVADLLEFCHKANADICKYASENDITSMGTTAAMLAFVRKGIVLCNIGDSKIFRFSDGRLEQISKDHVAVAAYGVKPPLSQNLGIPPEEMVIDPYLAEGRYRIGDVYLICSDGLTDMVTTDEITEVLSKHVPNEAIGVLLDRALGKGGKDNITIILCKIERKSRRLFK